MPAMITAADAHPITPGHWNAHLLRIRERTSRQSTAIMIRLPVGGQSARTRLLRVFRDTAGLYVNRGGLRVRFDREAINLLSNTVADDHFLTGRQLAARNRTRKAMAA